MGMRIKNGKLYCRFKVKNIGRADSRIVKPKWKIKIN